MDQFAAILLAHLVCTVCLGSGSCWNKAGVHSSSVCTDDDGA